MNVIQICERLVGPGHPCFVIAEAGSNHDGKLEQAYELIDIAVAAGADAVKFQLFSADRMAAQTKEKIAILQDEFGKYGENLYQFYRQLELPTEWLFNLKKYADRKNIIFLVTPFDEVSADLLATLPVPAYKIASFEMVHLPLVKHIAKMGMPLIVSTGMGDMADIEDVVDTVREVGNEQLVLLHCGIGYPMAFDDVHLAAMDTMKHAFQVPVGYSDHTAGISVPVAAVARGANVIEKHYTVNADLIGPDHQFALGPDQLKSMVQAIRDTEAAIGSHVKTMRPSEKVHYDRGRRSLFAAVDIPQGVEIRKDMLAVLRPGIGIAPKHLDLIMGRKTNRTIIAHEPITWDKI